MLAQVERVEIYFPESNSKSALANLHEIIGIDSLSHAHSI